MSWTDVKHVVTMDHRWKDPLHFAVMAEIAKRYNPTFGYAWPSLKTIGRRYSRSPRRVNEVVVELEEVFGLVIRLGLDPDVLGSAKGTQRFVPIWRVENGVQQQLREAIDAVDAAHRGAAAVENPVENSGAAGATDAASRMGACGPSHGGHAAGRMGGMRPIACDQGTDLGTSKVPSSTSTAAAAEQPRLPTLLAQIRRSLVDEILRKRRAFLATVPASDDNFRAIARAASDVLADPRLGARLVRDYDADEPTAVRDAVRLLCEKRHIDWGKPSYDVIYRAIAWAELKPQILAGEARPRNRARRKA